MAKKITAEMERMVFAKNLKALLGRKGKTQSDMARDLDIAVSTINSWATGEKYPGLKNQQIISDYFGVSRRDLLASDDEETTVTPRARLIPVLGSIACGEPIFCEENIEGYEYSYSKKINSSDDYFYLRTKGDSMMPNIPDEALVLIRAQSTVENGEIAAVVVGHDSELTLKRFKRQGNTIVLLPDNSNHNPIIITDSPETHVQIIGKAVSYYKDLES